MGDNKLDLVKVVTPKARLAFPSLWKPRAFRDKPPTFSATLLFDKKTDLKAMQKAVMNAAAEKWGSWENRPKRNFTVPFHNGDEKSDLAGFEGNIYVKATSKAEKPPAVLSAKKQPLAIDDGSLYSGCYVHAVLIAVPWEYEGMKFGVRFNLQAIMKAGDGERFSGARNMADEFAGIQVEDSSDDPSAFISEDSESDPFAI